MKKHQNSNQSQYIFIGILFSTASMLAAFSYSNEESISNKLVKHQLTEVTYEIEKIKKPDNQVKKIIQKKQTQEKTSNLKKDITSTIQKTKNNSKTIKSNVITKGLNLKYNKDPNYKIIEIIPDVVDFPDKEASFTGGFAEMTKYITHNLNLNSLENFTNDDDFLVHLEFVVSSDGKVYDVKIAETVSSKLKTEILKLMTGMPKWIPAELSGRKVNSRIFLPIRIYFQ